jgi:hypothetical protein
MYLIEIRPQNLYRDPGLFSGETIPRASNKIHKIAIAEIENFLNE